MRIICRLLSLLLALVLCVVPLAAQRQVTMPARDQAANVSFRALHTIGAADGADWETFGSIASLGFDARDNLYVLDRGSHRVMVYDASGRFVRQIGRKGGGPGNFSAPMAMAVFPDGRVVVSDVARRAFSVFDGDGKFLRSIPFAGETALLGTELRPHPQGGIVTREMPRPSIDGSAAASRVSFWHYTLVPEAEPRLIAQLDDPAQVTRSATTVGHTRTISALRPAFAPSFHWDIGGSGELVIAAAAEYQIDVIGSGGEVEYQLLRPLAPRPVTPAMREREADRWREQAISGEGVTVIVRENGGSGRSAGSSDATRRRIAEEMTQNMRFAPVVPIIQDLEVDPRGRTWVRRAGDDEISGGPIDLIDSRGRYLGTIHNWAMPGAFSRSGRTARVGTDELGVQPVVVELAEIG